MPFFAGIFCAIETFLDSNCDKEINLNLLYVLQRLIRNIAIPKRFFNPDLAKSLFSCLRRSIEALKNAEAIDNFASICKNIMKFTFGLLTIQDNFQRFNRDLQIELLKFLAKLAECDPRGEWAKFKYEHYKICSHDDQRLDVITEDEER